MQSGFPNICERTGRSEDLTEFKHGTVVPLQEVNM